MVRSSDGISALAVLKPSFVQRTWGSTPCSRKRDWPRRQSALSACVVGSRELLGRHAQTVGSARTPRVPVGQLMIDRPWSSQHPGRPYIKYL